jgi:Ser/Thr protein kinase RdoA (MazF antagonist)
MNATFASGDIVIRVGRPEGSAEAGLELLDVLASIGIAVPTPLALAPVRAEGLTAIALRRLEGTDDPIDWIGVGRMIARLHAADPGSIPAGYPLVDPRSLPWWDVGSVLAELEAAEGFDDLVDGPSRDALRVAVERRRHWRGHLADDAPVLCHGDLHPGNVMMTADGPILLDWDLMAFAPAVWDHVPLIAITGPWGGDPQWYRAFAEGLGQDLSASDGAAGLAEVRNLVATLMRLRVALTDHPARPEARLRLAHWRGERPAPRWTAT